MKLIKKGLIKLLIFYKKLISPFLGQNCRFYPSCSQYAIDCLKHYSLGKAIVKSIGRILRCHPFHKGGYDPALKEKKPFYFNSNHHYKQPYKEKIL